MKKVTVKRPNEMVIEEVAKPNVEKDFALVKVKACAICATDLEVIAGNIPAKYPITLGHEWSGIVEEVGGDEYKSWIGKRVTGSNDVVCLKCEACRKGEWRYCKSFEEIGFKRDGAYAEYVAVPAYGLVELPDSLSFEEACLAEPLGVALGCLKKAKVKQGETLLIYGAGSIGLCVLKAALKAGMRKITVVATTGKRLRIAEKAGAYKTIATKEEDLFAAANEIAPDGFDVVVDATGIEECIQNSLKLCRKGGKVVLAGYGRGKVMNIRIDDIHINNLKVIGAGNNWNMHKKAIETMEDGVDMTDFISARLKLEDFHKGIELAKTRPEGFVKAVFTFD